MRRTRSERAEKHSALHWSEKTWWRCYSEGSTRARQPTTSSVGLVLGCSNTHQANEPHSRLLSPTAGVLRPSSLLLPLHSHHSTKKQIIRRHTTNSNIHTYTTIMLADMSVPCRSPVTPTIPKHRLPILLLANSRDMWKCTWDNIKIRQKRSKSAAPAKLPNFLWDLLKVLSWQRQNAAILRDFLKVWTWQRQKQSNSASFCTWQHQKRNNSARLPHFSKLTPSKTKQFCETCSTSKMEIWVQSWRPRTNAFSDLSTPPV